MTFENLTIYVYNCYIHAKLCFPVFNIYIYIYGTKRIALNFESKSIEATYVGVVYHQSKPFKQYS